MNPLDHPILHCLHVHGMAVTIDEIRSYTGLSRRAVEAEIEDLRLAGEPIVAGPDGISLTSNPGELARYLEQRRHRAAAIHRGTMALRSTLREMQAPALTLWPDR